MELNNKPSFKSLCGFQDIYTDFDSWLCCYRAYFSQRDSINHKTYNFLQTNQAEESNKINNGISIKLQHLIVEGFITNKTNDAVINDCYNFLKFIQNGDDYMTFINGGKNYMRSKLLFYFIIKPQLH